MPLNEVVHYSQNRFYTQNQEADKYLFDFEGPYWSTVDPFRAFSLFDYCDDAAKDRLRNLKQDYDISRALSCDLSVECKEGLGYLPYQTVPALYAEKPFIIIADDMGVGKTIQAIMLANYRVHFKLLVICPASLLTKWKTEIEKWHLYNSGVQVVTSPKQQLDSKTSLIMSYNRATKIAPIIVRNRIQYDLLIIDEGQNLTGQDSQRSQAILTGIKHKDGRVIPPVITCASQTVVLSGTLTANRANELFNFCYYGAPKGLFTYDRDYFDFLNMYCHYYNDVYGPVIQSSKNTWLLHNKLRAGGFMIRRKKTEVLPQLPEKRFTLITIPSTGKNSKLIKKEAQFNEKDVLSFCGIDAINDPGLPEVIHEAGLAKVSFAADYVKNLFKSGANKILVGAWHLDVLSQMIEQSGLTEDEYVLFSGATKLKDRDAAVKAFQTDDNCLAFYGQLKACGEGLDLVAASTVVLVETYWNLAVVLQFIDRLHRIGQKNPVEIHFLVFENSIDVKLFYTALNKDREQSEIYDGV